MTILGGLLILIGLTYITASIIWAWLTYNNGAGWFLDETEHPVLFVFESILTGLLWLPILGYATIWHTWWKK